jgi:hypothetical protein
MHWPRSAPPCIEPYRRRQQGNTGLSRRSAASAEVSLQWSRTHRRSVCNPAKGAVPGTSFVRCQAPFTSLTTKTSWRRVLFS